MGWEDGIVNVRFMMSDWRVLLYIVISSKVHRQLCWYIELVNIVFTFIQGVQLKSGPYFNISNLFTKTYNMLYYTTNLYLQ